MNKLKLTSGFAAMAIAVGAFAATPINAAGTDVSVGVTSKTPETISVTVPTNVPIAVVKSTTETDKPTVLVGSTTTTAGNVTDVAGSTSTNGEGTGSLLFKNESTVDIKVSGANVSNEMDSKWSLAGTKANLTAKQMNLTFDGLTVGNVAPGMTGTTTGTQIDIAKQAAKAVEMKVAVGGTSKDYTDETDATAFHITWTVEAE